MLRAILNKSQLLDQIVAFSDLYLGSEYTMYSTLDQCDTLWKLWPPCWWGWERTDCIPLQEMQSVTIPPKKKGSEYDTKQSDDEALILEISAM